MNPVSVALKKRQPGRNCYVTFHHQPLALSVSLVKGNPSLLFTSIPGFQVFLNTCRFWSHSQPAMVFESHKCIFGFSDAISLLITNERHRKGKGRRFNNQSKMSIANYLKVPRSSILISTGLEEAQSKSRHLFFN